MLQNERGLCNNCLSEIKCTDAILLQDEFRRKFAQEGIVNDFYSPFIFEKEGPLQSLIHNLKYRTQFTIGKLLGEILFDKSSEIISKWNAEIVVPIPLHPLKRAGRGYNQAEFIARGLIKNSNMKIKRILRRKKYTETQTQLSASERRQNITNAFILKRKTKMPESLILIDDVITTGSTITEAAKVLKANGAINIYGLSIAIAEWSHPLGSRHAQ